MMLDASPFWQNAFLVAVFVALGWCVWSGWRAGIVRAAFSMVAATAGCLAGVVVGMIFAAIMIAASPVYAPVVGLVAGSAAALVVYMAVSFVGGLLFKRTAQQPTSILRIVYGLGGALVGVFVGLSVFSSALLLVRSMGGFCEATVDGRSGFYALPLPMPIARGLVKLKRSIEAGRTGKILESMDVVPAEYYRIMEKFGRVIADPETARRFVTEPAIRETLADMHFLALTRDPEVQDIARSQNPGALLGNPKVLQAARDPGLIAKLQKIDIEKALDYALKPPKPGAKTSERHSKNP